MTTKREQLRNLMAADNWRKALRMAAKWPQLGEYRDVIRTAASAYLSPQTYRGMGKDPEALIEAGKRALIARYGQQPEQQESVMSKQVAEKSKNVGVNNVSLKGQPIFTITKNDQTGLYGWRTVGKIERPTKDGKTRPWQMIVRGTYKTLPEAMANAVYTLLRFKTFTENQARTLVVGDYVAPVRASTGGGRSIQQSPDYLKAMAIVNELVSQVKPAVKAAKRA